MTLDESIKIYCKMLQYPKEAPNPHDDPNLYRIAYYSDKEKKEITPDEFLVSFRENHLLKDYSDEYLIKFAKTRIKKIEEACYIISCLDDIGLI